MELVVEKTITESKKEKKMLKIYAFPKSHLLWWNGCNR